MARSILGPIAGYLIAITLAFGLLTVAFEVLGPDGAFKPDSYDISTAWIISSLAAGLVTAIAGGLVSSLIARNSGLSLKIFIGIIIVLGAVSFILAGLTRPEPENPRTSDTPMFEAIANSSQPQWVALANPLIGIVGVLVAYKLRAGKKSAPPMPPVAN